MLQNINELSKSIYEQNVKVGWWEDPNRCILTTLLLVCSEISEAMEGVRKDLQDDKLPHRKMVEVELADTATRILDLLGRFDIKYKPTGPKAMDWMRGALGEKANNLPARLLVIKSIVIGAAQRYAMCGEDDMRSFGKWLCGALDEIMDVSTVYGYDLAGALEEKKAFNATRPDHSREARAGEKGKKF